MALRRVVAFATLVTCGVVVGLVLHVGMILDHLRVVDVRLAAIEKHLEPDPPRKLSAAEQAWWDQRSAAHDAAVQRFLDAKKRCRDVKLIPVWGLRDGDPDEYPSVVCVVPNMASEYAMEWPK